MDVLAKFQALHADLASVRHSSPPPPFDDESWLPFGNSSQKGGVFVHADRGSFCVFVDRGRFRLYLGDSWCIHFFFFFAHDIFVLLVVYVRGRHLCFVFSFFYCFLFHIWYSWLLIYIYKVIHDIFFCCCVKSRIYLFSTHVLMCLLSVSRIYRFI